MPRFASPIQTLTVRGSDTAGGILQLSSTSHATKGKILLGGSSAFDEAAARLGIGTASPAQALDVVGNAAFTGNTTVGGNATVTGNLQVGGIGQIILAQKATPQSRAVTTMIAAADLAFTAAANAKYFVSLRASLEATNAVECKVNWLTPGDASMQRCILAPSLSLTSNIDTNVTMIRRGAGTEQYGGGGGAGNFTTWWEDILLVTGATAGTIQAQFAPVNAGTATMHSDSFIVAIRVA